MNIEQESRTKKQRNTERCSSEITWVIMFPLSTFKQTEILYLPADAPHELPFGLVFPAVRMHSVHLLFILFWSNSLVTIL